MNKIPKYVFLFFTSILFVFVGGCVSKKFLNQGSSLLPEIPPGDYSSPAAFCTIDINVPTHLPGQKDLLVENPFSADIFYYPLQALVRKSFEHYLYSFFQPPGGDILNSFSIEVSVARSELLLKSNEASYALRLEVILKEPNQKTLCTRYIDIQEMSSFNGEDTPIAVRRATVKAAQQYLDFITKDKGVLASVRSLKKTRVDPGEQTPPIPDKSAFSWIHSDSTRVLCIGVSEYDDPDIPKVKYALNDARAVKRFLAGCGIPENRITCLENERATRNIILDEIYKMKRKTTEPEERNILYFSGHGAPVVHNGRFVDSLLVPYDARLSLMKETSLPISELHNILKANEGQWLIVMDSCFSGSKGRSVLGTGVKGLTIQPRNLVESKDDNLWWLTATSGKHYANEDDKHQLGLFTHYFLKSLSDSDADANKDKCISLREAYRWTREKVDNVSLKSFDSEQRPELVGGSSDIVLTGWDK